jgi:FAD/FMN-containing dehydrogenase
MTMTTLRRLDGSTLRVDLDSIGAALGGELLHPNGSGYGEARTLWNAMIDRRPGLIVRVASEDDVVKAVAFARKHRLLVAVKGAGHNIAGNALVEGGLVIDFGRMKRVAVEAEARVARVEPGATLAEVDQATQQHGLLVPTGINSTTGIAGLTLGGGIGWTTRKYGLTIDNLRAVRIVTAAGRVVRASRNEQPDLFWAVRGGGGNFGVVTQFEFDLHRAGPEVIAGLVVHPFSELKTVIKRYQQLLATQPDELTCWVVVRKAPPLPFLPAEWHGREVVVLAMCHIGERAAGESATGKLRAIGRPIADVVGPTTFAAWQTALDPLLAPGARNYWKSHDIAAFDDASLDVVRESIAELPTEECEIIFAHLGGAMTRVATAETAWPNRSAHFVVNVHTRWRDAKDDERCRTWARKVHERLAKHAMGSVYVNFMPEGDEDRVAEAYGQNYERLVSIKRASDPDNMFRGNQNVAPQPEATPRMARQI